MTEQNRKLFSFLRHDFIALFLCVCIFWAWFNILIFKFDHFGYYDWDLAIYANAMWALIHGSLSGSLWGTNFLTNHPELISILITPIYVLFPSALTLITLKLLSVISGGFVLYLIAKEKIGWLSGIILMLLYFAFPANFFMLIFEFHFESLAIVFLFLVYYYARTRVHYMKFIVCCILASLCKENIPLVIFMFGFMSLCQKEKRNRKFAWTAMGIGAGIFILEMFVITPFIRQENGMTSLGNPYIGLYWSGHEKLSMLNNINQNLHQYHARLFNPKSTSYLKDLFFPLLFLPLLGFRTLLTNLPLFLQNLLSSNTPMHGIHHHYAATLVPFLFLATLEFIEWAKNRIASWLALILTLILSVSVCLNWTFHITPLYNRISSWQDANDDARKAFMKQIPPNAGVISSFEFLSHLANRSEVYPLRNIWNNQNIFISSTFFIPPRTPYALINENDPWLLDEVFTNDPTKTQEKLSRLKNFYFDNPWTVKAASGEIVLLKRIPNNIQPRLNLVETQINPFTVPLASIQKIVKVDDKFQLLTSEFSQNKFENFKLPSTAITFYWKANADISDHYTIKISIRDKKKYLLTNYHNIGYAVYATPLWKNGDYIKETYWLDVSSLPAGEFSINIAIVNETHDHWAKLNYQKKDFQQLQIGSMIIPTKTEYIDSTSPSFLKRRLGGVKKETPYEK